MKKYANTDAMNILPHVSGTNYVGARAQSGSRVKNKDRGLGASMEPQQKFTVWLECLMKWKQNNLFLWHLRSLRIYWPGYYFGGRFFNPKMHVSSQRLTWKVLRLSLKQFFPLSLLLSLFFFFIYAVEKSYLRLCEDRCRSQD